MFVLNPAGPQARKSSRNSNSREHFLRVVAVTGLHIQEVIRITNARAHVKEAVSLLVTVSARSEGLPIRIARRTSEVILEAIEDLTQLGGKWPGWRNREEHRHQVGSQVGASDPQMEIGAAMPAGIRVARVI